MVKKRSGPLWATHKKTIMTTPLSPIFVSGHNLNHSLATTTGDDYDQSLSSMDDPKPPDPFVILR